MTRPLTYETGKIPSDPEERARIIFEILKDIEVIDRNILAQRGGVPFSREEIEQLLDEVRGRTDADLD